MRPLSFAFAVAISSYIGGGVQAFRLSPTNRKINVSREQALSPQEPLLYLVKLFPKHQDSPANESTIQSSPPSTEMKLSTLKDLLQTDMEGKGIKVAGVSDSGGYEVLLPAVGRIEGDYGNNEPVTIEVALTMSAGQVEEAGHVIKDALTHFGADDLIDIVNKGHSIFSSRSA